MSCTVLSCHGLSQELFARNIWLLWLNLVARIWDFVSGTTVSSIIWLVSEVKYLQYLPTSKKTQIIDAWDKVWPDHKMCSQIVLLTSRNSPHQCAHRRTTWSTTNDHIIIPFNRLHLIEIDMQNCSLIDDCCGRMNTYFGVTWRDNDNDNRRLDGKRGGIFPDSNSQNSHTSSCWIPRYTIYSAW